MNGRASTNLFAIALTLIGAAIGFYVPIVGVVLTVCLLLVLLAALLGDEGGAMTDLVAAPFTVLGRWLAQRDESRWLRRGPFIGLLSGTVVRWVLNNMAVTGSA
jgi:hypothetical protein